MNVNHVILVSYLSIYTKILILKWKDNVMSSIVCWQCKQKKKKIRNQSVWMKHKLRTDGIRDTLKRFTVGKAVVLILAGGSNIQWWNWCGVHLFGERGGITLTCFMAFGSNLLRKDKYTKNLLVIYEKYIRVMTERKVSYGISDLLKYQVGEIVISRVMKYR